MKKYFITGLVILLPLAITIAFLLFLVNFLTKPFVGAVSSLLNRFSAMHHDFLFLSHEKLILYGSKILILLLLFSLTVLLGVVTRWFLIRTFFKISDRIIHKIPIVNTVYKTTQEIINTLFVSDKNAFKQVVMAPFPRNEVYVLALVVREAPRKCSDAVGSELVSVLVPTTPNPTTGFLLMYKKSDLIYVDVKPEDAIKYVVSCGVLLPTPMQHPPAS